MTANDTSTPRCMTNSLYRKYDDARSMPIHHKPSSAARSTHPRRSMLADPGRRRHQPANAANSAAHSYTANALQCRVATFSPRVDDALRGVLALRAVIPTLLRRAALVALLSPCGCESSAPAAILRRAPTFRETVGVHSPPPPARRTEVAPAPGTWVLHIGDSFAPCMVSAEPGAALSRSGQPLRRGRDTRYLHDDVGKRSRARCLASSPPRPRDRDAWRQRGRHDRSGGARARRRAARPQDHPGRRTRQDSACRAVARLERRSGIGALGMARKPPLPDALGRAANRRPLDSRAR